LRAEGLDWCELRGMIVVSREDAGESWGYEC